MQNILTAYRQGFVLTNKSYKLILFHLPFLLLALLKYVPGFPIAVFISISIINIFLNVFFTLTLPSLFHQIENNQKIRFSQIITMILISIKRGILSFLLFVIALPLILLLGVFCLLFVIFGIPFMRELALQKLPPLPTVVILCYFLLAFLCFVPSFFSLEKRNMFSSAYESFKLSLNNILYPLSITLCLIAAYAIVSLFTEYKFVIQIILLIFAGYLGFIIHASSYITYKNNRKK